MALLLNKGPIYTTSSVRKIIGEDHLGIKAVGISIADHLQTGITSITPRARYWAFFAWVLHDFIQHDSIEKTMKNFKTFLKKQEWFFILANIADAEARSTVTNGVIGSTKGTEVWNNDKDFFEPFFEYVKETFGGYATYRNVMKIVGITMIGDETRGVHIDRLTEPTGKNLAIAFEQSIKDTEYYKKYRLINAPVPREVIREYGHYVGLDRLKEDTAKEYPLLENIFMPQETKNPKHELRKHSMLYFMNIVNQSKGKKLSFNYLQDVMYDGHYHRQITIPNELQTVAKGWEIYQARQLFTYSLDTIWSYVLDQMSRRIVSMRELISIIIKELENSCMLDEEVKEMKKYIPLSQNVRKVALSEMDEENKNVKHHVWQPILVMLDVNQRLQNRNDFERLHKELLKIGGRESISFTTWNEFVQSYQHYSIRDFVSYLLRYFILEQHQKVALNKMITTRNETYHFVENDGKLYFISDDKPAFNVFRVNQGLSILEDLGLIVSLKGTYQVTSLGQVKINESN